MRRYPSVGLSLVTCLAVACTDSSGGDSSDDPIDEVGFSDGKVDGETPTACQTSGVLSLVNDPTTGVDDLEALDVGPLASVNLIAHRDGADARPGTADDNAFADLAEVDAVPNVGVGAFRALLAAVPATCGLGGSAVIQLFDWPFAEIEPVLCSLRDNGYSHVHVSPPQLSNGGPWWGRYQPLDLRVIDGPLGNEDAFRSMTAEAKRCDIAIVADVVLNHAANLGLEPAELYYPPGCDRSQPLASGPSSCLWAPENFNDEECVVDWNSHCAVLYGRICGGGGDRGLPDLATGHCEAGGVLDRQSRNYDPHVLAVARAYLLQLADHGVTAIRIDAAKHMHPAFVADLLAGEVGARLSYVYGEVITDRANDASMTLYRDIAGLDLMDFPLTRSMMNAFAFGGDLGTLRSAVADGRALDPGSSVAFVTQHDVWGNADGLGYRWGGADKFQDELLGHMFITGRAEGIPYIFSEIEGHSQSGQYRTRATSYIRFHERPEVQAMVRFHAQLLGQPTRWAWEEPDRIAFARGSVGLVAINKAGTAWNASGVDLLLSDGTYEDAFTGNRIAVQNGHAQLTVPARWGVMLRRVGE